MTFTPVNILKTEIMEVLSVSLCVVQSGGSRVQMAGRRGLACIGVWL